MTDDAQTIYMQYLGAMSLLGRVARDLSSDEQDCVDRAFADANRVLEERESQYVFKRAHSGSYALFDR